MSIRTFPPGAAPPSMMEYRKICLTFYLDFNRLWCINRKAGTIDGSESQDYAIK